MAIPRSSSAVGSGPPVRAVGWQLQVRPANGFGWVPDGFGSALAGAATTPEPRTTAAPTSKFVNRGLGFGSIIATYPLGGRFDALCLLPVVSNRLGAAYRSAVSGKSWPVMESEPVSLLASEQCCATVTSAGLVVLARRRRVFRCCQHCRRGRRPRRPRRPRPRRRPRPFRRGRGWAAAAAVAAVAAVTAVGAVASVTAGPLRGVPAGPAGRPGTAVTAGPRRRRRPLRRFRRCRRYRRRRPCRPPRRNRRTC